MSGNDKVVKVLSTHSLIQWAKDAEKYNRNRQVIDSFYDEVDPDGTHVIGITMFHNDRELRCQVLCKMKGEDEPTSIWLDIDPSLFRLADNYTPSEV